VADLGLDQGGLIFSFLSLLSLLPPFSSKMKEGLKERLHYLWGSRGGWSPLDPPLAPLLPQKNMNLATMELNTFGQSPNPKTTPHKFC